MKINWIVTGDYSVDAAVDIDRWKSVGPIWGSWRSWRSCNTDNVICHDLKKCRELLDRAFQAVCNFYVPKSFYESLARPMGVKLYDGEFREQMDGIEDIIAMHLAASHSDIVLMLGYDLTMPQDIADRLEKHKLVNRHGLIRSVIAANQNVQWVAVDTDQMDKAYQDLTNLTCDKMNNVLELLL